MHAGIWFPFRSRRPQRSAANKITNYFSPSESKPPEQAEEPGRADQTSTRRKPHPAGRRKGDARYEFQLNLRAKPRRFLDCSNAKNATRVSRAG